MARNIRAPGLRSALLLALVTAQFLPTPSASAQGGGPSLGLSPSSGPPPSASGSLGGGGWCPDGGVEVSGAGGSASIGRDGSLSGEFSVSGSAGQAVTVTVTAFCADGTQSASATFTFEGGSSSGGSSGSSPTRSAPAGPPPVSLPTTGTLTISHCLPAPDSIGLQFVPVRLTSLPGGTSMMFYGAPIAGKVRQGTAAGAFLYDLPKANPGELFEVRTHLSNRLCEAGSTETADLWVVGSGLSIFYAPAWTTHLWGSTRISSAPVEGEVKAGEWDSLVSASGSLAGVKFVLKWETTYPGATAGLVQASALPFPTGSETDPLAPDGLIASWPVTCVDCVFSIDLSPIGAKFPAASSSSFTQADISAALVQLQAVTSATTAPTPAGPTASSGAGAPIPAQPALSEPYNPVQYVPPGGYVFPITGFYFRILPVAGETPGNPASNAVRMEWDPTPQGVIPSWPLACLSNPKAAGCPTPTPMTVSQPPYLIQIISYKAFDPPAAGHAGCYLVTQKTSIMYFSGLKTYNVGDKFCQPKEAEEGWLEKAWSYATGALNWISQAYADLKAEVVNLVAKFVPGELCGKQCLGTILDGTLASMGIPPSIPNFDQLVNQGMDYLAEQAAMQVGIPPELTKGLDGNPLTDAALQAAKDKWADTVKDMFKQGMQAGLVEAQKALAESVSYVPDGVPVKPDPDGEYQMPTMVLRLQPNPKYAGPACTGTGGVHTSARVEGPGLTAPVEMFWKLSKPLMTNTTYGLFEPREFLVPALSPGEKLEIPIVFAPYNDFVSFPYSEDRRHAWEELFKQGTATFSVKTSCGGTSLIWQPDTNYPWVAPALRSNHAAGTLRSRPRGVGLPLAARPSIPQTANPCAADLLA